jgi:microcystin-dependent protein
MSDQFVGEVRVVGFNFAPTGWAQCNGQLLPISQNTALFSLLGTTYGGDGKSTFALPDIQGQVVLGPGQSPGTSLYDEGQAAGSQDVTLLTSEMPSHNHGAQASIDSAQFQAPGPPPGERALAVSNPGYAWQSNSSQNLVNMNPQALSVAGGSLPHNNMQPYLVLNYIIALQGIFPQRP